MCQLHILNYKNTILVGQILLNITSIQKHKILPESFLIKHLYYGFDYFKHI